MKKHVVRDKEIEYPRIYEIIQNILFEDPSVTEEQIAEIKNLARSGRIRDFMYSPTILFCDDKGECEDEDVDYHDYDTDYSQRKAMENFWNGNYSNLTSYQILEAIDQLFLDHVIRNQEDVDKVFSIIDKVLADERVVYKENLLWLKADYLNANRRYDEALTIYTDLVSISGRHNAHLEAGSIIAIKMKCRLAWSSSDFVYLWRATDFNIKLREFPIVYSRTRRYLDALVSIYEHEFGWEYFVRMLQSADCKIVNGLVTGRNWDGITAYFNETYGKDAINICLLKNKKELKRFGDMIFSEMKILNAMLLEIKNVDDDWIEELNYFVAIKKTFPKLRILHHYNTPWLWKFNLDIFIPSLRLGFLYQGGAINNSNNFESCDIGRAEYFRLLNRTLEKAKKIHSIKVVPIAATDSPQDVCKYIAGKLKGHATSEHATT